MAYISKGLELSYKTSSATSYTELTDLYQVPELGGKADSIECTTLKSASHEYNTGLLNYGDSIDFLFWYAPTQFLALKALEGQELEWKVGIPDGEAGAVDTTCTFTGGFSVSLDGKTYNEDMSYTLSIKPNSEMVFA